MCRSRLNQFRIPKYFITESWGSDYVKILHWSRILCLFPSISYTVGHSFFKFDNTTTSGLRQMINIFSIQFLLRFLPNNQNVLNRSYNWEKKGSYIHHLFYWNEKIEWKVFLWSYETDYNRYQHNKSIKVMLFIFLFHVIFLLISI